MNLDEIRQILVGLSAEERRYVLATLPLHPLEVEFGIRAERLLDSILRASDLTRRGIRGIIAEEVFLKDVLPKQLLNTTWQIVAIPASEASYDVVVENHEKRRAHIQVKNQRLEGGRVKTDRNGNWVVEVQKTRTGRDKDGAATRPYRFSDFDLIAVCLRPGTGDWEKFAFALTKNLTPRKEDQALIQIMQPIPASVNEGIWSDNLVSKLAAFLALP